MPAQNLELVLIKWNDAEDFTQSAWASQKDAEDFTKATCLIESVGWVVKKTKNYIAISSDFDIGSKNYGTLRKIPRKMVVSIESINLNAEKPQEVQSS